MLFKDKESICTFEVLKILSKGQSKYTIMFKQTKVSHHTLQKSLHYLIKEGFIRKYDLGHKKVDYEITKKGDHFFNSLVELRQMLKV